MNSGLAIQRCFSKAVEARISFVPLNDTHLIHLVIKDYLKNNILTMNNRIELQRLQISEMHAVVQFKLTRQDMLVVHQTSSAKKEFFGQ